MARPLTGQVVGGCIASGFTGSRDHHRQRGRYSFAMSNVLPFPSNPWPDENDGADEAEPRLRDVIGDVLRDERQQQERTLADVANESAVSLPYLSEVERGEKEVSSDLLRAICDALELQLVEVLERAAERLRIDARAQRSSSFQLMAA
jgi:DNA-binding Xre family transcriptional regulator